MPDSKKSGIARIGDWLAIVWRTPAWAGGEEGSSLIVKGQSNLLHGVTEVNELDQIRELFQVLDTKERLNELLDASIKAEGVQIFIGSENNRIIVPAF